MNSTKTYRARINKDGTVSTLKVGVSSLSISEVYHWLITISWVKFYAVLTASYVIITTSFATAYLTFDPENLTGLDTTSWISGFRQMFFFSAQTLSMVGGLGVVPQGGINNFILTAESMVALSLLTLITGLLFARFSKQAATLIYGEKALIAPYKGGKALMIRLANARKRQSALVDMEAKVVFAWYDCDSSNKRNVEPLKLEMKKVAFIPISWTIVHRIDEKSPFMKYNLNQIDFEVLVRISATDSITGQNIYSGQAYSKDELEWDSRFKPCSEVTEDGITVVHLDQIGAHEKVETKLEAYTKMALENSTALR